MKWLNTCLATVMRVNSLVGDEGHMRVLFIFDDEDDEDKELVLPCRKGAAYPATFGQRHTLTG